MGKGSSFKVLVPSSQHSSTIHNYTRHLSGSDTVFIPFHSSMGNEANIDVSEHSTTIVLCPIPGKKRVWQTQVKFLGQHVLESGHKTKQQYIREMVTQD